MRQEHKQINIECLRIICALMVIAFHMIAQSSVLDVVNGANYVFAVFFHAGGRLACSVFVIIGAYFLVDLPFRSHRIIQLYMQTLVTVATVNVIIYCFFRSTLHPVDAVKLCTQIFPIFGKPYWFVSTYIFMLAISPILNLVSKASHLQNYRYLLIISSIGIVAIGSLPIMFSTSPFSGDLAWFCFLYLLTGEFKQRHIFYRVPQRVWGIIFLVSYVIACSVAIVCNRLKILWEYAWVLRFFYISTYQSFFAFCAAISLFGFFIHVKISSDVSCKMVETISPHTLGIFLIHQVPILYTNGWIWNDVFHIDQNAATAYFPLYCIGILITCVLTCFLADLVIGKICMTLMRILKIPQFVERLDKYIEVFHND